MEALSLLLVEDNELDRMLVRRLLGDRHTIVEAATAREALAALEHARPDLVLLDYRLPDLDGLDLLPKLQERGHTVVMLTGIEDPVVIVEAMRLGAQNYLVKGSFSAERLDQVVRAAVEAARLRREVERQRAALDAKSDQLRELASALTLAEHDERHRIALLLHDELQQQLVAARMGLYEIKQDAGPHVRDAIGDLDRALGDAIKTTRNLAVDLTPPVLDQEQIGVALQWVADRMADRHQLTVVVAVDDEVTVPSRGLRVLLIQLVRELLFNVVKHAGVTEARVRAWAHTDGLSISVHDEGRGFDPAQIEEGQGSSLGLRSVRHRLELVGGQLDIEAAPEGGARFTIHAPIAATGEPAEASAAPRPHPGGG